MKNIFKKIKGSDGSHCGLTDLYPEHKTALIDAIKRGRPFTTGWWTSKKEIASARVSFDGTLYYVEVSVSNDFDTEGNADEIVVFRKDADVNETWDEIEATISAVWDRAIFNQKENDPVVMYAIGKSASGRVRTNWIETYLIDKSGCGMDCPPGDNYHKWGWQDGADDLSSKVKKSLEKGMNKQLPKVSCGGYIAEKV